MKIRLFVAAFCLFGIATNCFGAEDASEEDASEEEEGWSFDESPLYEDELDGIYDPLEPFNRLMFGLNDAIDKAFLVPASGIYKNAVPNFMQDGISNFVSHFFSPISLINFILQGDAEYATKTTFRFIINTLLGFFGTIDVAEKMGLDKKDTFLGDTFKKWGAEKGPYLVLPLFGGGSFRSGMGKIMQLPIDPLAQLSLSHWKKNTRRRMYYSIYAAQVIVKRSNLLDIMMELEKTSEDMYITTRNAIMSMEG